MYEKNIKKFKSDVFATMQMQSSIVDQTTLKNICRLDTFFSKSGVAMFILS